MLEISVRRSWRGPFLGMLLALCACSAVQAQNQNPIQEVAAPDIKHVFGYAEPPAGSPLPPPLVARGFILKDLNSQQILAARGADEVVPPASLTKLMTAYVVWQALDAGQVKATDAFTISDEAAKAATGGRRRALFEPGTKHSVDTLMKAMAVLGASDAAVALAEGVAGSHDAFVERMNRQAEVFGLTQTKFSNADGRVMTGHASTPRELAVIAARLLQDFPKAGAQFAQATLTIGDTIHPTPNILLQRDPSVDGLQVASAARLGYAMAATSRRTVAGGERRLVAVAIGMNSPQSRAIEVQKLLNWGFSAFDAIRLFAAAQPVSHAPVWKGAQRSVPLGRMQAIMVAVPRGQAALIKTTLTRQDPLLAPLTAGQTVGTLQISLGAQPWQTLPLHVLEAVPSAGLIGRAWDAIRLGIQ